MKKSPKFKLRIEKKEVGKRKTSETRNIQGGYYTALRVFKNACNSQQVSPRWDISLIKIMGKKKKVLKTNNPKDFAEKSLIYFGKVLGKRGYMKNEIKKLEYSNNAELYQHITDWFEGTYPDMEQLKEDLCKRQAKLIPGTTIDYWKSLLLFSIMGGVFEELRFQNN